MDNTQKSFLSKSGCVCFKSFPNIAIVKYWGKTNIQIPANPSISFTLQNSFTQTAIEYTYGSNSGNIDFEFLFEGEKQLNFERKLRVFFERVMEFLPWLRYYSLKINSSNNFPHSSGIASSASSYSALALGLAKIHLEVTGIELSNHNISQLARLGSGSACRSAYGGWNLWGVSDFKHSSNLYAIQINHITHPLFKHINDAILVVNNQQKKISSTVGHQLMDSHPYREGRIQQANNNISQLSGALSNGDWNKFSEICESEALSLHGLMMSSTPSYTLLEPNSLSIIQKLRLFREQNNISICFTIDAGPNIHVLYPDSDKDIAEEFIEKELKNYCTNNMVIYDKIGKGPIEI
ncbi:diphosphomevalonate decarboxylase [Plebeiibacterium marinum]|uniref:diphosphomevalonate decarboxylase n=1 Tax=Plebeiibacterium marinum TaxID=2992111 RepID=A0AAE3MG44_9BACT|nr:diphosphomevalonate decarboxylase [Plebeiobacterium marinum]MCW3806836.1 diphosphomevalonate decarboxylase [Plebeiobacterium marinum]